MECKFKQIPNLSGAHSLPVRSSQTAVNEALSCLLGNVGDHMYNKSALQKSKTFLKNKIISFQIDSVKQSYPPRPTIPHLIKEEQSPRIVVADCMRPMSAQIRHYQRKNQRSIILSDSKKTIQSRGSLADNFRTKRNTTSMKSVIQSSKSKRNLYKKTHSNEKRFFAVKSTCDDDSAHLEFIEELRLKKQQQENEAKKKQEFLKSIQLQSTSYTTAQAKFIQSISRKKFIYGQQGQIIEINGASQKLHLKKISAMSKSRVQIKQRSMAELKKFQQDLKQNIYIEFMGRQTYQSRPQTGKPHHSEKMQEMKDKLLSLKETKRNPQDKQASKRNDDRNDKTKCQTTQRQRQIKGAGQSDKGLMKKKIEKILFYQSPNSVYRVVNDVVPSQAQTGLTIQDL